ncbi:MAG: hypothetical protein Q4C47_09475, partial [Planctomycetia bacterium]|nr:hypothetical protein [Planctomycetia bacterium]
MTSFLVILAETAIPSEASVLSGLAIFSLSGVVVLPCVVTAAEYTTVGEITGACPAWSREGGAIAVTGTSDGVVRVEHTGSQDWAIRLPHRIDVRPGETYQLTCDVRVTGPGEVSTGVVLRGGDDGERVDRWIYGGRSQRASEDLVTLRARFLVPRG